MHHLRCTSLHTGRIAWRTQLRGYNRHYIFSAGAVGGGKGRAFQNLISPSPPPKVFGAVYVDSNRVRANFRTVGSSGFKNLSQTDRVCRAKCFRQRSESFHRRPVRASTSEQPEKRDFFQRSRANIPRVLDAKRGAAASFNPTAFPSVSSPNIFLRGFFWSVCRTSDFREFGLETLCTTSYGALT